MAFSSSETGPETNTSPENIILDKATFEANLDQTIKGHLNSSLLFQVLENLKLEDYDEKYPEIFRQKSEPHMQIATLLRILKRGCEQEIPEAGRVVLMLNNWVHSSRESDQEDFQKLFPKSPEQKIKSLQSQLEDLWKMSGETLNEAYKQNQEKNDTEMSEAKEKQENPFGLSDAERQKLKAGHSANETPANRKALNERSKTPEAMQEEYKEIAGTMKKTLQSLQSDLPSLTEKIGPELQSANSTYVSLLRSFVETIMKDSQNISEKINE
ncbi:MAG: hypothetical protein K9M51_02590 [Candidatus Gracilibacteria bacterium]|nr:hypothetical protein [Candidatus Gracilibacteria bacterium]